MRDWHPEDIKAAVRKRGHTLSAIGASIGLSRQAMARALVRPGIQAEAAIARVLEISPAEVWPSRYNSDGTRRRPQPASNYRPATRFASRLHA